MRSGAYHVDAGVVVEVAHIEGGDRAEGGLGVARVVNGNVVVGRYSGSETMCCPTHVTLKRRGAFATAASPSTHVGPRLPVER